MAYSAVLPSPQGLDKDYSFLEALSIGPAQQLPFSLVAEEKLGLPSRGPAPVHSLPALPPIPSQAFQSGTRNSPGPAGTDRSVSSQGPATSPPILAKRMASSASGPAAKAQAQCLDICSKATKSGDRIAIHLLEYLTSVKQDHLPHGLDELAHGFLSTCQILSTLQAGLEECTRTRQLFPADLLAELEKKFCVCQADFQLLDQTLIKILESERKSHSTMGKMKRGLSKLFGDVDFVKITLALQQTRESLRMSALMFQWSLGEEKIQESAGIGYTGLAAVLNKLDHKKSAATRPRQLEASASQHHLPMPPREHELPPHPPLPWTERSTSLGAPESTAETVRTPTSELRHWSATTESSAHSAAGYHPAPFDRLSSFEETMSQHTGSDSVGHDALTDEIAALDLGSNKVLRLKVDPRTMPRWNPRNSFGSEGRNLKGALASAIRARNHKNVEQLLDQGVSPNTGPDLHVLIEAVKVRDVESVRLLLLFGADPNDRDRDGMTPLATAVEKSLLGVAYSLLKYGADPNLKAGMEQDSPLARAAQENKLNMAHLLLMHGGDVSQFTSEGNTIILSAINKKTPLKLIDILLAYGGDPNAKSREGKTALFEAITSSRVDIVTSLLEHGANPNLPGPKHMLWPATWQSQCLQVLLDKGADHKKCPGIMELATSINNIESVRILLKAGVDPNAKKDGVYTPLCTSIRDDRPDIFDLLLKNRADPNVPASEYPAFKCLTHNRLQYLPLLVAAGVDLHSPKGIVETAVCSNNMDGLLWLLDKGLDPNEKNPKGHSPLTTAIRERNVEMVEVLMMRGADPNKRGEDWPVCMAVHSPPILRRILSVLAEPRAFKGVIERAVAANQIESVKLLLHAGVSVEDKNGGVFSPLTTAIRENRREIVTFLLDPNGGGADVNAPGEHLPIVKALRRFRGEDTTILEQLLAKGADPNKMYRDWNAMFQAVELADVNVLRLLKDGAGGVNMNVTDEMGRNVLEMAVQRAWDEGIEILQEGPRK